MLLPAKIPHSPNRSENSIGAFFEYNFDNLNNLNLTAGIRADKHNKMGTFLTS